MKFEIVSNDYINVKEITNMQDMAARQLSEWFGPARVGSRSKL